MALVEEQVWLDKRLYQGMMGLVSCIYPQKELDLSAAWQRSGIYVMKYPQTSVIWEETLAPHESNAKHSGHSCGHTDTGYPCHERTLFFTVAVFRKLLWCWSSRRDLHEAGNMIPVCPEIISDIDMTRQYGLFWQLLVIGKVNTLFHYAGYHEDNSYSDSL